MYMGVTTLEETWAVHHLREGQEGQAILDAGPALREDLLYVAQVYYRLKARCW